MVVGSGEKLSKAMNEFVVQEMILSGFCQDDFVERVMDDKEFIPVPLLPSKVAAGDNFGEVQLKGIHRKSDGRMDG